MTLLFALEIISTVLCMLYLYLEVKQNMFFWPLSIVVAIIYSVIYFKTSLFGLLYLQFFFIVTSILGWIKWYKNEDTKQSNLKTRNATKNEYIIMFFAAAILSLPLFYLLKAEKSVFPVIETIILIFNVLGVIILIYKIIDVWWIFLLANILSVIINFKIELYWVSFTFVIYSVVSILGWRNWLLIMKQEKKLYDIKK